MRDGGKGMLFQFWLWAGTGEMFNVSAARTDEVVVVTVSDGKAVFVVSVGNSFNYAFLQQHIHGAVDRRLVHSNVIDELGDSVWPRLGCESVYDNHSSVGNSVSALAQPRNDFQTRLVDFFHSEHYDNLLRITCNKQRRSASLSLQVHTISRKETLWVPSFSPRF